MTSHTNNTDNEAKNTATPLALPLAPPLAPEWVVLPDFRPLAMNTTHRGMMNFAGDDLPIMKVLAEFVSGLFRPNQSIVKSTFHLNKLRQEFESRRFEIPTPPDEFELRDRSYSTGNLRNGCHIQAKLRHEAHFMTSCERRKEGR